MIWEGEVYARHTQALPGKSGLPGGSGKFMESKAEVEERKQINKNMKGGGRG